MVFPVSTHIFYSTHVLYLIKENINVRIWACPQVANANLGEEGPQ